MTSKTTDDPVDAEVSVSTPLDVPGQPPLDLDRAVEAILFIADEPQSVVQIAAGVGRPVAEVRLAIEHLRADCDGEPAIDPASGRALSWGKWGVAGATTCVRFMTNLLPMSCALSQVRGCHRLRSRHCRLSPTSNRSLARRWRQFGRST